MRTQRLLSEFLGFIIGSIIYHLVNSQLSGSDFDIEAVVTSAWWLFVGGAWVWFKHVKNGA